MKINKIIVAFILIIGLSGCGGGSDSTKTTADDNNSSINNESDLTYKIMESDWEYSLGNSDNNISNGTYNWVYTPTINNNTLYVTSFYNLYAINTDGTLKWSFESTPFNYSSIAINNNIIYLTQRDGSLTAINENGSEIWKYDTNKSYAHTPSIGCDNSIYFKTSYMIHALDVNGNLKWETGLDYTQNGSTVIDNDCNIYTSTSNNIVALDANGNKKWFYPIEDFYTGSDAPKFVMDHKNRLYIKTSTSLTSIDNNGSLLWSYKDIEGDQSPVIDKNNVIYFSDSTGIIHALESDGTLKWKYEDQIKDKYDSGGFMSIANNKIFINTHHQLYALTMSGELIRQDVHLADVWSNPMLINNKLYVGEGMFLKAYTINNDGYQVGSHWPTRYYNNQHTRNKADKY